MSSTGTAKKFDLKGVLHNLFGNSDIDIEENDIESLEKIDAKKANVTEQDMEELKRSSNRLKTLADRYGIEPKKVKTGTKTKKIETVKIEKRNLNIAKEERDIGER